MVKFLEESKNLSNAEIFTHEYLISLYKESLLLDQIRFLECSVYTIFLHSLDSSSRELHSNALFEFRNIDPFFLKVCVFSYDTSWVKLGCTSSV